MSWLRKAWAWVRKSWPWLRWVIGLALLGLGVSIARRRLATRGGVYRKTNWQKIPGDAQHILVKDPRTGAPTTVQLPPGIVAREVRSAGIGKNGGYTIETHHDPIDLSADGPGDPSLPL